MRIGEELKIFAGTSNIPLAQTIMQTLNQGLLNTNTLELADGEATQFPDGETRVQIRESVRGADCFIIQTTHKPVNHHLMEMLVFADALKRASAWRVNAVIPYFGYARQDKKAQSREPITAKLVANLIETAGIDRVITIDLHAAQIQGFFDVPVDHLTALSILAEPLKGRDLSNAVIVSPDVGRATEGRMLANMLNLPLAILYKRRRSPTETETSHVIGEVKGKSPIMIDDMITTAGTLMRSVEALLELGAKPDCTLMATHPVLAGPAHERLQHDAIREIIVTDTIPYTGDNPKVNVLSVAPLLAAAIANVHHNKSVSTLFAPQ